MSTLASGSMGESGGGAGAPARDRGRWAGSREVQVRLDKLFDKMPPHAPEAEMALLGAMLLDWRVMGEVVQIIKTPEAFYSEAHAAIYAVLVELYDRHQAGDTVQVVAALRDKDALKDVGGPAYIGQLASETPSAASAPHFARIVAEKAKLRRLIKAAGEIVFDAYHSGNLGPEGAREIIDNAERAIFEIAQEETTSDPQAIGRLLDLEIERLEAMEAGRSVSGVPTGYHDLDQMLMGLQAGEMIVLAARPSMGKTAMAMNIAENIAMGGALYSSARGAAAPVGIFSLEMSKSSVAQRLLSSRSQISSHKMRSGQCSAKDIKHLVEVSKDLGAAPIYVDDTAGLTVLGLRTRARRMAAQFGIKTLFVDYLQLMTAPGAARESRQVEVSAISRGIKALARELNIPVVCMSQLNRGPETRGDNRPRMSDLRESGSIEQDADVVMLLHREEYYHVGDREWENDPGNERKKGVAELIIAKQRNGPTGMIELQWDAQTTRFNPLARDRGGYADEGAAWDGGGGGGGGGGFGGAGRDPFKIDVKPFNPGKGVGGGGGGGGGVGFKPGAKTGPVEDFRDGGGPEREGGEEEGEGG